jgi:alpha-L-fucosidase 2
MLFMGFSIGLTAQEAERNEPLINLPALATSWEDGLPIGNGLQGALIWQKQNSIRFSLDRADLWDERPVKNQNRTEFKFDWVLRQWKGNNYQAVQQLFDEPYSQEAGPTKLPGAALEIEIPAAWGTANSSVVNTYKALAAVTFTSGVRLQSFVSAGIPFGFFRIQNSKTIPLFKLVPPDYEGNSQSSNKNSLGRLGYKQGKVDSVPGGYTYLQEGYNGFKYRVTVLFSRQKNGTIEGIWHITAGTEGKGIDSPDLISLNAYLRQGFDMYLTKHVEWWYQFWAKSDISIPDKNLQRHWYLTHYFLGSTSRQGGPAISLQSVWTADNGQLPPWKGDFHHDLNTQMSYWPAYTANHLDESMVFNDFLDARKEVFKQYTKTYFEKEGLNVPGVASFQGTPLGGWIQYAFSPTVSAWLLQHYYWQWKYSMNADFLKTRAYPWAKETALFLEQMTKANEKGQRQLPMSSSPEIFDNSSKAWFAENTNHDVSLMHFAWKAAAEMAQVLGNENEAAKWQNLAASLPPLAQAKGQELIIAPNTPYQTSHRHHAHLMAIYPLGLLKWEDGDSTREIINRSIKVLDSIGTSQWNGYSFPWQAALKARAHDGAGAAKALQVFTENFCASNGFHLNGDLNKKYTNNSGRPFTLEGNFGFAAALQEMLIQSHSDTILIMPAIPANWDSLTFKNLRVQGGMLIDAVRAQGKVKQVIIRADTDGFVYLKVPYPNFSHRVVAIEGKPTKKTVINGVVRLYLTKGSIVEINPTKWPYK